MRFSILVLGAPFSSQSAYSAYRFSQAAIASGHHIHRIFFYQDGVHNSSALATPPQDEFDLCCAWQELQRNHTLDLVTCIAAAARRGVLNTTEAQRHNRQHGNLAPQFELSGLGQLVEAIASTDRLMTFGH